ncbi:MAG: hypothetical protein IPF82_23060, partial [Blastocatellia bacterium]|nr:hypothetical protein [Blastocatellia bacterium]
METPAPSTATELAAERTDLATFRSVLAAGPPAGWPGFDGAVADDQLRIYDLGKGVLEGLSG